MQDSTKDGSSIKKLGHSFDTILQKNWSRSRIEKTGFYMQDSTKDGSSIKKLGRSFDTIPQKNWSKSRIEKTGFLYAGFY